MGLISNIKTKIFLNSKPTITEVREFLSDNFYTRIHYAGEDEWEYSNYEQVSKLSEKDVSDVLNYILNKPYYVLDEIDIELLSKYKTIWSLDDIDNLVKKVLDGDSNIHARTIYHFNGVLTETQKSDLINNGISKITPDNGYRFYIMCNKYLGEKEVLNIIDTLIRYSSIAVMEIICIVNDSTISDVIRKKIYRKIVDSSDAAVISNYIIYANNLKDFDYNELVASLLLTRNTERIMEVVSSYGYSKYLPKASQNAIERYILSTKDMKLIAKYIYISKNYGLIKTVFGTFANYTVYCKLNNIFDFNELENKKAKVDRKEWELEKDLDYYLADYEARVIDKFENEFTNRTIKYLEETGKQNKKHQ